MSAASTVISRMAGALSLAFFSLRWLALPWCARMCGGGGGEHQRKVLDKKGKSAWLLACEYIAIPCESRCEGAARDEGNLRLSFLKMFTM